MTDLKIPHFTITDKTGLKDKFTIKIENEKIICTECREDVACSHVLKFISKDVLSDIKNYVTISESMIKEVHQRKKT